MNRRLWIYGGVAAAAAAAGAAWSVWKPRSPGLGELVWQQSLAQPAGGELVLANLRGKPLLLNFWATWCPPCVEELPLLDAFYQDQKAKGWQVLGLAVDQPSAVRKWLQAKPLSFSVGMAGLGGTELSKSLGNISGGLPFTTVFGASGALLHRKTGKVSQDDLIQWSKLK